MTRAWGGSLGLKVDSGAAQGHSCPDTAADPAAWLGFTLALGQPDSEQRRACSPRLSGTSPVWAGPPPASGVQAAGLPTSWRGRSPCLKARSAQVSATHSAELPVAGAAQRGEPARVSAWG